MVFRFEFTRNLGEILPPEFDYRLDPETFDLSIANQTFAFADFSIRIASQSSGNVLVLSWPKNFMKNGMLAVFTKGTKLFSSDVSARSSEGLTFESHQLSSTAIISRDASIGARLLRRLQQINEFRYCVSRTKKGFGIRFCSGPERLKKIGRNFDVIAIKSNSTLKIRINGEQVTSKGLVSFNRAHRLIFDVFLPSGGGYQIVSQPIPTGKIDDIAQLESGEIQLEGGGTAPEGTIKLPDQRWRLLLSRKNPFILEHGAGEIPFVQRVYFSGVALPNNSIRPSLKPNVTLSTYLNKMSLKINGPTGYFLRTGDATAYSRILTVKRSSDKGEMDWKVTNLKAGIENKRSIKLISKKDPARNYTANASIYRGYRWSGGIRLGFPYLSSGGITILSQVHLGFAPERLFGISNYWLGDRRWSFEAHYLTGLGPVQSSVADGTFQARYRFAPGVRVHDATSGTMLEAQWVNFEGHGAELGGPGLFLSSPMPRVLSDGLRLIPGIGRQSWLWVQGVWDPISLSGRSVSSSSFHLGVGAQCNLTKQVYVDLALGLYLLSYRTSSEKGPATLSSDFTFATFGVGAGF